MALNKRDRTYFSIVLMDAHPRHMVRMTKKDLTAARKLWYKTRTIEVRKAVVALKARNLYHRKMFESQLHANGCNIRRMFDGLMLQQRKLGYIVKYDEWGYSPAYDVTQNFFK